MTTAVIADRYPADVTCPDGTVLRNARAILTRGEVGEPARLWLYTDRRPDPDLYGAPTVVLTETRVPHGRSPWTVTTDTGRFQIARGRGCGCGSVLRRWKPWPNYRLAGMPAEVQR
ncbi:hypothetical protein [Pseudonocardia sp. NPDC049635]|uniref:hypothetical protein n=1 Tax=Pseudonocardia sp. NPDC049635 TaxID=3155506 RepID=UPI003403E078